MLYGPALHTGAFCKTECLSHKVNAQGCRPMINLPFSLNKDVNKNMKVQSTQDLAMQINQF
jgi:hypothetical protein